MSMLALPETECQEILALFRRHLPHVPDAWLQDLASNYGQDAIKDIDPNDVIAILSVPGELHRIQIPLEEHEPSDEVHRRMCNELAARDIEPNQIAASLLTIQDSSAKLADIGEIVKHVSYDCLTGGKKAWCWYKPQSKLLNRTINLIVIVRP